MKRAQKSASLVGAGLCACPPQDGRTRRFAPTAFALLFILTLVACGGGGGGSTTDTSSSGGTSTSDDTATTTGSTATTRGSDPVTYNCPTDKCVVIDMEDRFAPHYGISDNISNTDNGGLGVTNWGDFSTAEFYYLGANPFTVLYDSTRPELLQVTLNPTTDPILYRITFDFVGDSGQTAGISFQHPASGIFVIGFN